MARGKIRWYGAATWDGFRRRARSTCRGMAEIAVEEGGPEHHFRFIQLPFNLAMVEAYVEPARTSVLAGGGAPRASR